jgi:hypothetical protein
MYVKEVPYMGTHLFTHVWMFSELWLECGWHYCSQTERWQGIFTHPSATTTHAKTTVTEQWNDNTSIYATQLKQKLVSHRSNSRMLKVARSPTSTALPTPSTGTIVGMQQTMGRSFACKGALLIYSLLPVQQVTLVQEKL